MRTKNPRSSGVKSAVDFNMAAGENSREKESCSAWKDEEVESLIDIFSEETIRRHFVLEELRMPGSSIQLHQLPKSRTRNWSDPPKVVSTKRSKFGP